MSNTEGQFCWYELMTSDPAAAGKFYEKVVGWNVKPADIPGIDYTMLSVGEAPVAGMMPLPAEVRENGGKPFWIGYVESADVDGRATQVESAGGAIHRRPEDIPGVGRFAVVADPQGAVFVLFAPSAELPDATPDPNAPGATRWHELHARDGQAAFDFYSGQFGWTKDQAFEMGGHGTYQLFAVNGEASASGAMWSSPEAAEQPFWLYYFVVEDIDDGKARVEEAGGQVDYGPQEVPGGVFIIHCRDPQGARFALVGGCNRSAEQ